MLYFIKEMYIRINFIIFVLLYEEPIFVSVFLPFLFYNKMQNFNSVRQNLSQMSLYEGINSADDSISS